MKRKVIFLLALVLLLCSCGVRQEPQEETHTLIEDGNTIYFEAETTTTEPTTEAEKPIVSHLMVGGDVMSHIPQIKDAYVATSGTYDYNHMFVDPAKQLKKADYAVANFETVLAGGPNYTGFPNFNSPDALAYAVKDAGFDLVGTANNHSRDQGIDGINRTLDVLDEVTLAHVGSYRSQEERDKNNGIVVADVGGISVAFLCYTYGLNGYSLPQDKLFAVNVFNIDYTTTLSQFNYDLVGKDLAAARALNTDMTAVLIHWGVEYQNAPNDYQKKIAKYLVSQGVDLIFGSHPHVLQPYEVIKTEDDNGKLRAGFVIYSFGNFISNQMTEPATKTTCILDLELTKNPATGKTKLTDVRYTPYYMLHRDDLPAGQRRMLVNIHEAMAEYEAGKSKYIGPNSYQLLKNALAHAHKILGEKGDKASK